MSIKRKQPEIDERRDYAYLKNEYTTVRIPETTVTSIVTVSLSKNSYVDIEAQVNIIPLYFYFRDTFLSVYEKHGGVRKILTFPTTNEVIRITKRSWKEMADFPVTIHDEDCIDSVPFLDDLEGIQQHETVIRLRIKDTTTSPISVGSVFTGHFRACVYKDQIVFQSDDVRILSSKK